MADTVEIAGRIPKANGNPSYVNEPLKDLMREGLVQANRVVLGLYRLTTDNIHRGIEIGREPVPNQQ